MVRGCRSDGNKSSAAERENEIFRQVLVPEKVSILAHDANLAYKKSRTQVGDKAEFKYDQHLNEPNSTPVTAHKLSQQIRAGFYVNWDAQSWYSLRRGIDQLNLVMPEWLFVPDQGESVAIDLDQRALQFLRQHKTPIMPMVSNFFNGKWNGANVSRILSSKANREAFIKSILEVLRREQFYGVNIDFEELKENTDERLTTFMRETCPGLSSGGLFIDDRCCAVE